MPLAGRWNRAGEIGGGGIVGIAVFASAPTLAAERVPVDLPAGTVGTQVMALGRALRANISVPDAGLWSRPVPPLRGRLSVEQALSAIARGSGARVEPLGPGAWRLTPRLRTHAPVSRAAHPFHCRRTSPAVISW
ncbi:STN domain-containing protein [Sphingomonas sp. I4]